MEPTDKFIEYVNALATEGEVTVSYQFDEENEYPIKFEFWTPIKPKYYIKNSVGYRMRIMLMCRGNCILFMVTAGKQGEFNILGHSHLPSASGIIVLQDLLSHLNYHHREWFYNRMVENGLNHTGKGTIPKFIL